MHRWVPAWGLGSVALGAASLLVPLYLVQLGGTPFDLGLLGASVAIIGAPGAIVWGRFADRTGNPRGVVLASLIGVALLLGLFPLLDSVPQVIAANALLWFVFSAAGPVVTLLIVADAPEDRWSREIALLNAYQAYGWAGGLLLGILWSAAVGRFLGPMATQRSLFVACGLIAALAAAMLGRSLPAPTHRQVERVNPERVARLISSGRRGVRGATFPFAPNRLYWTTRAIHPRQMVERFTPTLARYFVGAVLFFTGFAAFFAPLPLYLTAVGFSSDLVFGLYLISSLATAIFAGRAGALSGRVDLRLLQSGALGVRGLAMPLVAIAGTAATVGTLGVVATGVLFAIIGLTWAIIAVTAGTIVTRIAPMGLRGEALGVYTALSVLAGGVGSLAGGTLATAVGSKAAFVGAGLVIVVGAGAVATNRGITLRTRLGAAEPSAAGGLDG